MRFKLFFLILLAFTFFACDRDVEDNEHLHDLIDFQVHLNEHHRVPSKVKARELIQSSPSTSAPDGIYGIVYSTGQVVDYREYTHVIYKPFPEGPSDPEGVELTDITHDHGDGLGEHTHKDSWFTGIGQTGITQAIPTAKMSALHIRGLVAVYGDGVNEPHGFPLDDGGNAILIDLFFEDGTNVYGGEKTPEQRHREVGF